jgi:Flp pilus assembly pilin Flp
MKNVFLALVREDDGFVISAELVLVATISVLSLVVGLCEVSSGVNQELEDVGSAVGSLNQAYSFNGLKGCKAKFTGSYFSDGHDACDDSCDINCNSSPQGEGHKGH